MIKEESDKETLADEIAAIQVRIRRTLSLPIDNLGKSTDAEIDPTMYPPIKLRKPTAEELKHTECVEEQIYFGDPILDSIDYEHELAAFLKKRKVK